MRLVRIMRAHRLLLMVVVGSMAVCSAGTCGATEKKKSMGVPEEASPGQIEGNVTSLRKFLKRHDGVYSIFEAARAGDMQTLQKRLSEGSSIQERDEVGNTPMHVAADAGKAQMVSALLKLGADSMVKNHEGKMPLDLASNEETKKVCRQGIDARKTQLELIHRLQKGDLAAVREGILLKGVNPNVVTEDGTSTLLVETVRKGDVALVEKLLGAGADPNLQPMAGKKEGALLVAAKAGNAELVRILLTAGADINMRTASCVYPIHEAIWNNHLETVKALIPAYKKQNFDTPNSSGNPKPACMAIIRHNHDILQAFLEAGLDPNDKLYSSREPLLVTAAKVGDERMVKMLLKAGADKKARDSQGKTASDYAHGTLLQLLQ